MGETTIPYVTYSFNPWWGCEKVSAGCSRCYAETFSHRLGRDHWGDGKTTKRRVFDTAHFLELRKWNKSAIKAGERRRVLVASMGDLFEDNDQVVGARKTFWTIAEECTALDFLLLTKRPENISKFIPSRFRSRMPRNFWFGVSAEDQETLDERWSMLDSETHNFRPSKLWLSLEPLLEPVDLTDIFAEVDFKEPVYLPWALTHAPDWVIVGGESGSGCRVFCGDWARSIRDQCREAGISFFMKQFGGFPNKYERIEDFPVDLQMREIPK